MFRIFSSIPRRRRFIVAFFAFPLVAAFFAEAVATRDVFAFFHVISVHPGAAVFSYLWILSFFAFAYSVFSVVAPAVILIALFVLSSSHIEKLRLLGEPLYLTDILAQAVQIKGLADFSGIFDKPTTWIAIGAGTLLSWFFFWLLRSDGTTFCIKNKAPDVVYRAFRPNPRIFTALVFAVFHVAVFTNAYGTLTAIQTVSALKPEEYFWRQIENYSENGFIAGFFTNVGNAFVHKPEDYDRNRTERLAKSEIAPKPISSSNVSPDVILILSESFWDPTKLPGVTFSKDPIPNFRKLRAQNGGGDFISPVFGGKTALVEFEVLTGTPVSWLPSGSVPYQQYLRNPIPSVPFEFRSAGYSATAVHTYHKAFFNRSWAYPLLGFEKFIGLEDFSNAPIKGKFISDSVLTDTILSELANRKEAKSPAFVFAISMENHFSYEGDKYDEHEIDVSAQSLSEDDRLTLKNYVQGLYDADRELGRLVEELKKSPRPTVVTFFGDHLGVLGEEYRAYRKTGYLKTPDENAWTPEEYLSMHTTPFLVWKNFGNPESSKKEYGKVFAANFSRVVFDVAGLIPKDAVFHTDSGASGCLGVPGEKPLSSQICEKVLSDWRSLQYFHLFDSK